MIRDSKGISINKTASLLALAFVVAALAGCNQPLPFRAPNGSQEAQSGLTMLQRGDRPRAILQLDTAIKLAGGDYRISIGIAESCMVLRDWDLTAKYGELALKQVPRSDRQLRLNAYATLTSAYIGLGQADKAVQLAKEYYASDSSEPGAKNLLGYVYADVPVFDKLGEALDLTQQAVAASTNEGRPEEETATYLDSVGWVKYQQGRYDEAIIDLKRASFVLPSQPEVQYHLGKAYQKKALYEDAAISFQRTLKLSPRFLEAEQALKEVSALIVPKPDVKSPVKESPLPPKGPDANAQMRAAPSLPVGHP